MLEAKADKFFKSCLKSTLSSLDLKVAISKIAQKVTKSLGDFVWKFVTTTFQK